MRVRGTGEGGIHSHMHKRKIQANQKKEGVVVDKQHVLDFSKSPQRQRQLACSRQADDSSTVSVLLQQIKASVTLQASVLN